VPGERREEVLRAHELGVGEQRGGAGKLVRLVTDVVVGDHEALVPGRLDTGLHAADVSHRGPHRGRQVPRHAAQRVGVALEERRR
jgi:hypothetical protein